MKGTIATSVNWGIWGLIYVAIIVDSNSVVVNSSYFPATVALAVFVSMFSMFASMSIVGAGSAVHILSVGCVPIFVVCR